MEETRKNRIRNMTRNVENLEKKSLIEHLNKMSVLIAEYLK